VKVGDETKRKNRKPMKVYTPYLNNKV